MAKKAYIGIDGVARKIKKGYIGIDGVARKIKKAYIGIGGVARPCWSEGLTYYGEITPLNMVKKLIAATSINGCALFAGGENGLDDISDALEMYDTSLVKTSAKLKQEKTRVSATSLGAHAIFAGGYGPTTGDSLVTGTDSTTEVEAYTSSLVRLDTELSLGKNQVIGASNNKYAVFANGYYGKGTGAAHDSIDAFDESLTRKAPQAIGGANISRVGISHNDYAVFMNSYSGSVWAYNASLTKLSPVAVDKGKTGTSDAYLGGGSVNGYILIHGHLQSLYDSVDVEVYDASLTKLSPILCVRRRIWPKGVNLNGNLVVGNGDSFGSTYIEVFDASLTCSIQANHKTKWYSPAVATAGNFVLFAGGETEYAGNVLCDTVTAYVM